MRLPEALLAARCLTHLLVATNHAAEVHFSLVKSLECSACLLYTTLSISVGQITAILVLLEARRLSQVCVRNALARATHDMFMPVYS